LKFKLKTLVCLSLILANMTFTISHAAPTVWDVMRKEFMLNHEVTQPEVQTQLRWLVTHPSYLHKLAQSEPYIYHIVNEIKKRHIPGEIALIPMIESSYDPFAYSGAGAAGLWQLMPGTGTDLGLKQDWWFDGRRSIRPATDAALDYLVYLNKFFNNDWILAVAAYDSGEGTIARIIKNSHQTTARKINFWTLPVPNETKAYIPRLLALAEIIQNPHRYKIELPDIPHTPYFEEVNIGSQIDLNHAAKLAGISYHDLIKLNPGYNRWATAPYRPYKLLIPVNRVQNFNRNLANFPEDQRVSWTRHQVSAGDNLNLIAQRYHTTINLIKELNQMKSNSVKKGQFVLIPNTKGNVVPSKTNTQVPAPVKNAPHFAQPKQYKIIHIVQKNESYTQIEKKYHVSINQLKSWNRLNPQHPLKYGQQLVIWRQTPVSMTYVVKRGDTISGIARTHKTGIATLIRLNPDLRRHMIHPGQKIKLA
jgi:membrane-bound lytic murein transglycosylase D